MNKKRQHLSLVILLSCISVIAVAQDTNEATIRGLEKMEAEAFAKKDTATLIKLFSADLVVNAPVNKVMTYTDVMNMIRAGKIDVGKVEKTIEKVSFADNIAIVMGKDLITAQGGMENAGKTVTRRYTDIWIKHAQTWKLVARQATIVNIL